MMLPGFNYRYFFHIQHADSNFQFSSEDFEKTSNYATIHIGSFSVEEEELAQTIIKFTIRDDIGISSKIFRRGQRYEIKWGMLNDSFLDAFLNVSTDEISGSYVRGPLRSFVMSSKGHLTGGKHFIDVVLRAGLFQSKAKLSISYDSGTIEDVIIQKSNSLGFDSCKVSFPEKGMRLNRIRKLEQCKETDFEFLTRIANKFGCTISQNTSKDGKRVLIFAAISDLMEKDFTKLKNQRGKLHYLDYGNDQSNILESPDYDLGLGNSMGSTANFVYGPDGKLTVMFQASGTEKTRAYVLNTDKVRAAQKRAMSDGTLISLNAMIQASDFSDFIEDDKIKKPFDQYFDLRTFETAPEQMGWQFNAPVVPNPIYQIGDKCFLGPKDKEGASVLPPNIKSYRSSGKPGLWRLSKSTWEHAESGVSQKLEMKR